MTAEADDGGRRTDRARRVELGARRVVRVAQSTLDRAPGVRRVTSEAPGRVSPVVVGGSSSAMARLAAAEPDRYAGVVEAGPVHLHSALSGAGAWMVRRGWYDGACPASAEG